MVHKSVKIGLAVFMRYKKLRPLKPAAKARTSMRYSNNYADVVELVDTLA